ncbi:MAG: hypothetical protein RMY29_004875 [Nostoc sp. CreGUA01]
MPQPRSPKVAKNLWSHPLLIYSLTLSGKNGADADRYQEKDVRNALLEIKQVQEEDKGEHE